jgi:hypothetical protein
LSLARYRGMRHGEILTLALIPYRSNWPLLLGSWQGKRLVSLHKLTKTEGLQILGGVGLPEAFYGVQRTALAQLQLCVKDKIIIVCNKVAAGSGTAPQGQDRKRGP